MVGPQFDAQITDALGTATLVKFGPMLTNHTGNALLKLLNATTDVNSNANIAGLLR